MRPPTPSTKTLAPISDRATSTDDAEGLTASTTSIEGLSPADIVSAAAAFVVTASMPADGGEAAGPLATIAMGFSQQPDASFLNGAVSVQKLGGAPVEIPVMIGQAQGNPSTVLLTPLAPLGPGAYRVMLRGGTANALRSVSGETLAADHVFTFTVDMP